MADSFQCMTKPTTIKKKRKWSIIIIAEDITENKGKKWGVRYL